MIQQRGEERGEPANFLVREMELSLEHLQRSRRTKSDLIEHLESVRTPIDNRLLNLKRQPLEYSRTLWIERDRIRGQLMNTKVRIETQRHRVVKEYEREVRQLENRLLTLLNKHEQLESDQNDRTLEYPGET